MKTVAVAAGATAEFSRGVLIGEVEEQTRWGLGSLCARILAASAVPLAVLVCPAGQNAWRLRASEILDVDPYNAQGDGAIVLERGSGDSKSRPVVPVFPVITMPDPPSYFEGGFLDPSVDSEALLISLVSGGVPNLTLLSVLNRFESFLDKQAGEWILYFDQESEKLAFIPADSPGNSALVAAAKLAFDNADPGQVVADFTLTLDESPSVIPGYGWE